MTLWITLGYFFHGLAFFTLGLAIIFLHSRSRRILLARRLSWLSIFAFFEALLAWHDLLSLGRESPLLPFWALPPLQAVGYAFLLAFGCQMLLPDEETARVKRLPLWTNLLWAVPYGLAVAWAAPDLTGVTAMAQSWVRYGLALPGSLLTAVGLYRQGYQAIQLETRRRIHRYLRLIEIMVVLFGVLNGLLAPATPFFSTARGNSGWLAWLTPEWLWAAVGTGLAVGLTRTLTTIQVAIEQWIEGVERLQTLATDRERIGRELHDGIIQSIYASGLLLESVLPVIPNDPVRAQAQLGRVMDNLNETIQDIRRYIFDLRSDMPDDDLRSGIERLLRDFRINTLLETEVRVEGNPVEITSVERRRHIFQIVREALANTARHARAQWVCVALEYTAETLEITISDDGIGMETLLVSKGYGLRNIRERARLLDGALRIESAPGAGVTLHLSVPY
ncbi:MAG TPA: histidine kinase [Anaerolineae bacterium]|nr:histidine kinase [Anaerolineae bacterium]